MALFSPGFRGRRSSPDVPLPPGQYLTEDFPVLSAGPTPRISTDHWEFVITTEISQEHRWSWSEMLALPSETPTVGRRVADVVRLFEILSGQVLGWVEFIGIFHAVLVDRVAVQLVVVLGH